MTQQPEGRLQQSIQKALKERGYFVFKVHGSQFMMAGLPDLVVCAEGLFIGLEVKVPERRKNVSEAQSLVHERIRGSGGRCEVVCSPDEALNVVDRALEER